MKNSDRVSCTRPGNADGTNPWTVTGILTIDPDGVRATINDAGDVHHVWLGQCVPVDEIERLNATVFPNREAADKAAETLLRYDEDNWACDVHPDPKGSGRCTVHVLDAEGFEVGVI